MTSQVSWDHHTVPRLYLRGFCATKGAAKGKVLARRRADGADVLMTTKEATVIPGFYDAGEPGQPNDSLEHWFDRNVENPVGEVMATLRNGVLPSSTAERDALATFVALQMVRTIRFRHLMVDMSEHLGPLLFANLVLQRAIDSGPDLKDRSDLPGLHAQIAARAPQAVREASPRPMMRNMVREADRIKPLLTSMHWMIISSTDPLLLTGDAPVVTVSGSGEIASVPTLLPDLHEVQLPVTPRHLLTITRSRRSGLPRLSPKTKLASSTKRSCEPALRS